MMLILMVYFNVYVICGMTYLDYLLVIALNLKNCEK